MTEDPPEDHRDLKRFGCGFLLALLAFLLVAAAFLSSVQGDDCGGQNQTGAPARVDGGIRRL